MKVQLTRKSIGLLNAMLRPTTSGAPIIGQGLGVMGPYAASDDPGTEECRDLVGWLETKVLVRDKNNPEQFHIPEGYTGNLRTSYLRRINEIIKHYQSACRSIIWCEAYIELKYGLEGKECKYEDVEEPLKAE